MTDITINDADIESLKGKVIIVTGGSSGIGLASTKLFLSLGAKVVVGDQNPCPLDTLPELTFQKVDVREWKSQLDLFKKAIEVYGRVDHVFANAGMTSVVTYLEEEVDSNGDLLPPNSRTTDVNLTGVIFTVKLAVYYLKKYAGGEGSIVITASGASYGPFALTDYNVSKHGVLGLMRGMYANLASIESTSKIRINSVAPLWTVTGIVPQDLMDTVGVATQGPEVVARSVALLMADQERTAQVISSKRGIYREVDRAILVATAQATDAGPQDMPTDHASRKQMEESLMLAKKM